VERPWPVATVVARLAALGEVERAVAWVVGERTPVQVWGLREAVDALPPDARAHARARLAGMQPALSESEDDLVQAIIAHAACLDGAARIELLREAERRIAAKARSEFYSDPHYGDRDDRVVLAEGWLEAGELGRV